MKRRIEKCMKSAIENYTSIFQNDNLKANIQQIDLKDFVNRLPIQTFDLKGGLWQEMIVKEKEFRAFLKIEELY